MAVPQDPPVGTRTAPFAEWALDVADTAQSHEERLDLLEIVTGSQAVSDPVWEPDPTRVYSAMNDPIDTVATLALTLNRVVYTPVPILRTGTIDAMGVRVSTNAAGGSGALLHYGLHDTDTGIPGDLLIDAGTTSSESSNGVKLIEDLGFDVTRGTLLWFVTVAQVVTCSVNVVSGTSPYVGTTTGAINVRGYRDSNANSGALQPVATITSGMEAQVPLPFFRWSA